MKSFDLIKKLRKSTGLNQGVIAKFLGMSRPNYGNKENGKVPFTAEEFFKVLGYLKNNIHEKIFYNELSTFLSKGAHITSPYSKKKEISFWDIEASSSVAEAAPTIEQSIHIRQDILKHFINKEKGKKAYTLLVKLERLNKREFYKYIADLEGLVEELEEKQKQEDS
jgi:transcriptional regulator with XRE-family HTH domain